ncbi:protein jag [Helicobacter aurati]|uniref:Protein jag n=1 Tax=Helicobacter aurati TaxID=137778 RepID=A0A3D8J7I8_9HELI|nr:Jag N-terminal domain-containing protein [Helicobacter aurati]RDU73155.1 protein jag [Helicobacter aurati]
MKRFTANTIDSCLLQASKYFSCSIAQLDYEIVQNPSTGFWGFGKKEAIIIADCITLDGLQTLQDSHANTTNQHQDDSVRQSLHNEQVIQAYTIKNVITSDNDSNQLPWKDISDNSTSIISQEDANHTIDTTLITETNTQNIVSTCSIIEEELTELLKLLPLDIKKIEVKPYNNHTVSILIDGIDSALLIGQKGYRYKSLSYLLFNWIHTCYGYGVHLEIAQFLRNQEESIKAYLEPIIRTAQEQGKAETKPLDGVLAYIALKILRQELPHKYIVSRDTGNGEKSIIINSFINNAYTDT